MQMWAGCRRTQNWVLSWGMVAKPTNRMAEWPRWGVRSEPRRKKGRKDGMERNSLFIPSGWTWDAAANCLSDWPHYCYFYRIYLPMIRYSQQLRINPSIIVDFFFLNYAVKVISYRKLSFPQNRRTWYDATICLTDWQRYCYFHWVFFFDDIKYHNISLLIHFLLIDLEVCMGPDSTRGPYPARRNKAKFSNGPGRNS